MSIEAYLGEIRMFAGTYPPRDWAFCNGQILAIKNHEALFSLLGTMYGGDGRSTMALPDLRGRVPVHSGDGDAGPGLRPYRLGERGGQETVTLTANEMPAHSHLAALNASSGSGRGGSSPDPEGNYLNAGGNYRASKDVRMAADAVEIDPAGGNQAHANIQPYTALNFIICLAGVYPPRS